MAYGLLGTLTDAEDAVQDARIRLQRQADAEADRGPDRLGLITTTSRIALDVAPVRPASRREAYVEPWLPEPIETVPDPADSVSFADSISWAMLVVLGNAEAAERAAFVLHDVFGLTFDEVGQALGRNAAGCRQTGRLGPASTSRSENHASTGREAHREVVDAFAQAARTGDVEGLAPSTGSDVVLTSDGGGVVQGGARTDARGPADRNLPRGRVARQVPDLTFRITAVNGNPALLMVEAGQVSTVIALGATGMPRHHHRRGPQPAQFRRPAYGPRQPVDESTVMKGEITWKPD